MTTRSRLTSVASYRRHTLYKPALLAIRFKADMKAHYHALIAAGKSSKVATTAASGALSGWKWQRSCYQRRHNLIDTATWMVSTKA